jgi:hypothetical protein
VKSHIPFTYPNSDAEEDFYDEAEDLRRWCMPVLTSSEVVSA